MHAVPRPLNALRCALNWLLLASAACVLTCYNLAGHHAFLTIQYVSMSSLSAGDDDSSIAGLNVISAPANNVDERPARHPGAVTLLLDGEEADVG